MKLIAKRKEIKDSNISIIKCIEAKTKFFNGQRGLQIS